MLGVLKIGNLENPLLRVLENGKARFSSSAGLGSRRWAWPEEGSKRADRAVTDWPKFVTGK